MKASACVLLLALLLAGACFREARCSLPAPAELQRDLPVFTWHSLLQHPPWTWDSALNTANADRPRAPPLKPLSTSARVMESACCRAPPACCRPRALALHALFWGLVALRVFGAALLAEDKLAAIKTTVAPCWLLEEFVVTAECSQCDAFQAKTRWACGQTGYVEKVNCTKSNRDEYKSCRSAVMEEHRFWKFEAVMLSVTAVLAVLVVLRQRRLDRLASEKVRRQIESI